MRRKINCEKDEILDKDDKVERKWNRSGRFDKRKGKGQRNDVMNMEIRKGDNLMKLWVAKGKRENNINKVRDENNELFDAITEK